MNVTQAEIATNYCLTQNLLRIQTSEIDIDVEPNQLLTLNQIMKNEWWYFDLHPSLRPSWKKTSSSSAALEAPSSGALAAAACLRLGMAQAQSTGSS